MQSQNQELVIDLSSFNDLFQIGSDLHKFGGKIKLQVNPSTGETKNVRADIDLQNNESGTRTRRSYSLPSHGREERTFDNQAILFIDTNEHDGAWLTTSFFITKNGSEYIEHSFRCDIWEDNRVDKLTYNELSIDKEVVGIFWHLMYLILNKNVKNTLIRVFNDANLDQLDLVREFLLKVIENSPAGLNGNDFDICYISDKYRSKHEHNAVFSRVDKLHRQIKNGNVKSMREAANYISPTTMQEAEEVSGDKLFSEFRKIPVDDRFLVF